MERGPATAPLPDLLIEPLVRAGLVEDLGRAGDLTTDGIVPEAARSLAAIVARQDGVVAGLACARIAFRLLDPGLEIDIVRPDGSGVAAGETIATVVGASRAILSAERVALNFLTHLSGIATSTSGLVAAIGDHKSRICCTRKTTPGLRALEKYAVRTGGGLNHRFGLDDGILIKDNHIAVAGGVANAVARARRNLGHMVKIEVEVDTLAQLETVLALEVEAVLLDNMSPDMLCRAVALVDRRAVTEASGRVRPETVAAIAATGVDLISAGWITHSAPALDIGLDFA